MLARKIVIDALNAAQLGASAYRDVPSVRQDSFMVVELTGGPQGNRVQCSPSVDVDCWAQTSAQAERLAENAKSVLMSLPDSVENVFAVTITTEYDNPDLDSGTPRCTIGAVIYGND